MQRFFLSLCDLNHFAYSCARLSPSEACSYCHQHQYWVPHGFVYKQTSAKKRRIVARRLFCSHRYGRRGCGRTRQLYLAQTLPRRHYPLSTLIRFIGFLVHNVTVTRAYQQATGLHREARQAYRWLTTLYQQLGYFRSLLDKRHREQQENANSASHRLKILLPTLQAVLLPDPLAGAIPISISVALNRPHWRHKIGGVFSITH